MSVSKVQTIVTRVGHTQHNRHFVVPQALEILCAFVTSNRHNIPTTVRLRWDSSDGKVVSEIHT